MMDKSGLIYAPFAGIIPAGEFASFVAAPPYDVLSSAEAKERAKGKAFSFLHISKAEIDFEGEVSPYCDKVYQRASKNFAGLLNNGVLIKDNKPCFYIYRMETKSGHVQTGLAVAAAVKAYNDGRIKRHELTREAKENDRVKQIRAVGAQTGPALLINKDIAEVKALLGLITARDKPLFAVEGDYGVIHSLWRVSVEEEIAALAAAFNSQNEAYIADGHHRSAAAARLAKEEGTVETGRFLAVAFFESEMRILDYNRVATDLNGLSAEEFLHEIKKKGFDVAESGLEKPVRKGQFVLYLAGKRYELNYRGAALGDDPVSSLDVSILSRKVFDEILGIKDLRTSERVEFIGGIRGAGEVERKANLCGGAGFMVYPTAVSELLRVADAGMLMPPKSTWFEPKLADGLVSFADTAARRE